MKGLFRGRGSLESRPGAGKHCFAFCRSVDSRSFDEATNERIRQKQYRLAFLTDGVRNTQPSQLGVYDAFVKDQANQSPELAKLGAMWAAIASTSAPDPDVSAKDNTGTNPDSGDLSVPVYNLLGQRIADGNSDLWDGSLDAPIVADQFGNLRSERLVVTGTLPEGSSSPKTPMGRTQVAAGLTHLVDNSWVHDRHATG